MRLAVFTETLRQHVRQIVYWGVGLGLLAWLIVIMVPDVDGLEQMKEFIESLPPVILGVLGVGDDISFMATPEGFIATGFFGKSLIMFLAYPIVVGLRITVAEEHEGTMDMTLSLPIPRWRVVLEKFLAYTVALLLIIALMYVGLWVGVQQTGLEINMTRTAEATLNIAPSMMLMLAFTLFVGTVVRQRKYAIGIAVGFLLYSYAFDVVGSMAIGTVAENLRVISFFKYYNSTSVMQNGLILTNFIGLLALAAVLFLGSLWAFERRDISV